MCVCVCVCVCVCAGGHGRQVVEGGKVENSCEPMGLHGGSLGKNLRTSAGDTGSIPDPGRSHMSWIN